MSKRYNVTVCVTKEHKLSSDKMTTFKKKVGLDLSFQSEARWPDQQKSQYITSLIMGMAPSKIIVADIESCMESVIEDSEDYTFFSNWLNEGKDYISIDGNNRTITIDEYLNGKVSVLHGEYKLPVGAVVIGAHNDNYYTHPKLLKEHIVNNINVSVCEYTTASLSDLSDLFISINNGVALNPQEMRNAILVPLAKEIRELSKQYGKAMKHIKKDNSRRAVDEQFVNLSVYYAYGASHGISKKDKDNAYEQNSTVWQEYNKGGKKVIEDTMKLLDKYGDIGFSDVSTLLNFFIAITQLSKEKRIIHDKEKFFKWFKSTENARIGDQTILADTKEGEKRTYAGCSLSTSDNFLQARYEYIFKDLQNIPNQIVSEIDVERLFTKSQRYQMWARQDGKCPRTGKTILEDDINNHDLWAADHVIPYAKGGPTTLDNGELVCKRYNLSKGAKMPELVAA